MTYNNHLLTEPVELDFVEAGTGTPLLLLHGYPLSREIWAHQLQSLSQHCRVIAPDLRGHGKSPAPEGAYSMDLFTRDVLMLLDKLNIHQAIWAGHSMGGYITLAAYRLAPERFSGFAMVASNYKADNDEGKQKRLDAATKVAAEGAKAALNPNLFSDDTPDNAPARQLAEQIMLSTPPSGIIGALLAIANRPDSDATLKTITVPSLILAGQGDKLFKPEIAQHMADTIPDASLVMIEHAGHLPMMEEPELVSRALLQLLNSVEKGS